MKTFILFLLVFLCSCSNNRKKEEVTNKSTSNNTEVILSTNTINHKQIETQDLIHFNDIDKFQHNIKIGHILLFEHGQETSIASNDWLTYGLLGYDHHPEAIKDFFKNINFEEQIELIEDVEEMAFDEPQTIYKLIYKDSFIKVYLNSYKENFDIISARIIDKELLLANKITVGMCKYDFFNTLFNNIIQSDIDIIEIFRNGDELGEIDQIFIFKNDTLSEIIIKSDYSWIPFDL